MNTQTNNKRRYKLGTYTVFVTLIAVALAIGFNLFFNEIPANLTAFDLSNEKIYTIDDSTKELIASIDKDITIYLVAVQGQEDLYISEIIEKYAALSSHIKVVHRDPAYFPTFVSKYTTEQLQTNSLIVESEDRYKIIKYSDIYVAQYYYDQSYNMQQEVSFYLHSQLASALDYVTSDSLPKLYMLTGHGGV